MPAGITTKIMTVTPDIAREWLNGHNRNLRETVWQRYARDMSAGRWVLNGETIKRSHEGHTLDGQHRLKAIVESGASIETAVVFDLPQEAQETIDRGLPRNLADALKLRGEVNVLILAGAITNAILMVRQPPMHTSNWPSTPEALAWFEEHPSIVESISPAERLRHAIKQPSAVGAGVHFTFAAIDQVDADDFFAHLAEGDEQPSGSPILAMRTFLIKNSQLSRGKVDRRRLAAYFVKAWNAYRRGDRIQVMVWRTGGATPEPFPTPE